MSPRPHVPVIGLVGGVGSGKSSVARTLAARRSVVVVDGDAAGHAVLAEPEVQTRIRERFGPETVDPDTHAVRRPVLAALVFGVDETHRTSRRDLEGIVHPPIRQRLAEQIALARKQPGVEAILLDAAVLLEAGWRDLCDAVLYVDVPEEQRRRRVAETRGWSAEELRRREASQLDLEAKRAAADGLVDNSGSVETAALQLERHLDALLADRSTDAARTESDATSSI